jgi:chromosome partitioning protein
MRRLIAFVNQKGGCGKSTSAVHHCAWLQNQGFSVVLIDADTQHSSSDWASCLPDPIQSEAITTADALLDRVPEIKADRIVIDAPAGLAEESRAVLYLADLVCIPIQASGLDLRSSGETFRRVRQVQRLRSGNPIARSFISRSTQGTRLEQEAIAALDSIEDISRLNTIVRQRTSIADASVQQCTVEFRIPRDPNAINELNALSMEIEALTQAL